MAEGGDDGQERTEPVSPERREEFRERGQVAMSNELVAVFVLFVLIIYFTYYTSDIVGNLKQSTRFFFSESNNFKATPEWVLQLGINVWLRILKIILPLFIVAAVAGIGATLLQTRFNWSWQKLSPDFSRLNPLEGLKKLFGMNAAFEALKGILKLSAVSLVAYLVLYGEWKKVPRLIASPLNGTWAYWGEITESLFKFITGFLVVIAGGDYAYNFFKMNKMMMMSKQEVRQENKNKEGDPLVKGRMRRMQRDMSTRKMLEATKTATVVLTNPTHYAVALRYDPGMGAPVVVAKGIDFLALRIREAAASASVPVMENPPLARALYKLVNVNQEIPVSLYNAIAEIIRYVFKKKKVRLPRRTTTH